MFLNYFSYLFTEKDNTVIVDVFYLTDLKWCDKRVLLRIVGVREKYEIHYSFFHDNDLEFQSIDVPEWVKIVVKEKIEDPFFEIDVIKKLEEEYK